MPAGWVALGTAVVGAYGAYTQGEAAKDAAHIQAGSAQAGIDENRRQFDQVRQLLNPYVNAGAGALNAQQTLIGLNGTTAQQAAINGIQNGPQFQSMLQQGQNSILQNASATGGLRGGNTQSALGQFSPQLLNQLIQQQYQNLGGLTSIGQNAAAGVGNAGMQSGQTISGLLGQQGAALAGGALAQGQQWGGIANSIGSGLGMYLGLQRAGVGQGGVNPYYNVNYSDPNYSPSEAGNGIGSNPQAGF